MALLLDTVALGRPATVGAAAPGWLCRLLSVAAVALAWEIAGRVPISFAFPTFLETIAALGGLIVSGERIHASEYWIEPHGAIFPDPPPSPRVSLRGIVKTFVNAFGKPFKRSILPWYRTLRFPRVIAKDVQSSVIRIVSCARVAFSTTSLGW